MATPPVIGKGSLTENISFDRDIVSAASMADLKTEVQQVLFHRVRPVSLEPSEVLRQDSSILAKAAFIIQKFWRRKKVLKKEKQERMTTFLFKNFFGRRLSEAPKKKKG